MILLCRFVGLGNLCFVFLSCGACRSICHVFMTMACCIEKNSAKFERCRTLFHQKKFDINRSFDYGNFVASAQDDKKRPAKLRKFLKAISMNVIQHLRGMRKLEICVCVVSVLIGGFFGYIAYKAIGTLTGAVGGWLVGEAWCYYMRKLAAKVGWIFGSLFIIGGVLGGIAGIVDGVFLHLVCFPLYGETLNGGEIVLRSILDCLAIGAMCGGIYGCFNGAFWGLIYSIIAFMERRNKKLETAG